MRWGSSERTGGCGWDKGIVGAAREGRQKRPGLNPGRGGVTAVWPDSAPYPLGAAGDDGQRNSSNSAWRAAA